MGLLVTSGVGFDLARGLGPYDRMSCAVLSGSLLVVAFGLGRIAGALVIRWRVIRSTKKLRSAAAPLLASRVAQAKPYYAEGTPIGWYAGAWIAVFAALGCATVVEALQVRATASPAMQLSLAWTWASLAIGGVIVGVELAGWATREDSPLRLWAVERRRLIHAAWVCSMILLLGLGALALLDPTSGLQASGIGLLCAVSCGFSILHATKILRLRRMGIRYA